MTPSFAAIVYEQGFAIDSLMAQVVERLKAGSLRLGGVVQQNSGDCDGVCDEMALVDVASGTLYPISQARGTGGTGCRLDAAGLAEAGGAVARALSAGVDLVLVNRFGKQEALGHGLRAEIAAGCLSGRPLLTAVRRDHLVDWEAFAGEDWQRLPPDVEPVARWALAATGRA